jgi:hypothetical protein
MKKRVRSCMKWKRVLAHQVPVSGQGGVPKAMNSDYLRASCRERYVESANAQMKKLILVTDT